MSHGSSYRPTPLAVAWPILLAACLSACGQEEKSEDPDGSESTGTVSSGGGVSGGSQPAQQEVKPAVNIDPALAPFIEDYKDDAAKYGVEINSERLARLPVVAYVDSTPSGADATCFYKSGVDETGTSVLWTEIYLLKSVFILDPVAVAASGEEKSAKISAYTVEWYYEASNKLTVYHELTHCLLNKGHSTVRGSIMERPFGTEHLLPGQAVIPQTPTQVEASIQQLFSEDYLSALGPTHDPSGPL